MCFNFVNGNEWSKRMNDPRTIKQQQQPKWTRTSFSAKKPTLVMLFIWVVHRKALSKYVFDYEGVVCAYAYVYVCSRVLCDLWIFLHLINTENALCWMWFIVYCILGPVVDSLEVWLCSEEQWKQHKILNRIPFIYHKWKCTHEYIRVGWEHA